MIICRTPLRVSLFGGGLDYPEWFNSQPTSVLNFSLNQYTYIMLRKLKKIHSYRFRLRYFKTEEVKNYRQIKHGPYREIIKYYNLTNNPLEITYTADLPALSGLGSSSSSTVGLINACNAYNSRVMGKKELSQTAIMIERDILKENVGYQDQICSAFGGLNEIYLNKNSFQVNPILNKNIIKTIDNNFYLYYTGVQRKSNKLEKTKINKIRKKIGIEKFNELHNVTNKGIKLFKQKNLNLDKFCNLLNLSWKIKKEITPEVSSNKIDRIINRIKSLGVKGAKLIGSGNGGYILFVANKKIINKLKNSINNNYLIPIKCEFSGSQVIFNGNFSDI